MENEEKKMGCCENKDGTKCEHGMHGCCHNWKKCHMIKKLFVLIIIILAFCLGTKWGEMKSESRGDYRFERGGMMNWGYGRLESDNNITPQSATGAVTVQVNKLPTVAPVTTTAPKQ